MKGDEVMEHQNMDAPSPVDPRTLVLGLARRWRWILVWTGVSFGFALAFGLLVGSRTYQAETVLLYRPRASLWTGTGNAVFDSLSFETQRNLVKVRSNMEEVRELLELPASLSTIGQALEVNSGRSVDLMVLVAYWTDPAVAASLANTTRDVFLRSQVRIRYKEELTLVERLLRESRSEKEQLASQIEDMGRITRSLEARIDTERAVSPEAEGLGDVNIRVERLRDAIYDDQTQRANVAMLTQKEIEFERAQELVASGSISELEFVKIKADYESTKALAVDTDQVARWRSELERLQATVIPSEGATAPSAPLLQQILLRAIDLEFDLAGATEKVRQLEELNEQVKEALATLDTPIERADGTYVEWLADSDFRLITPAREPVLPSRSNRKLVAIGSFVLLFGLGVVTVLAFELLKKGVRSAPEARLRLGLPVLGALPGDVNADRLEAGPAASLGELHRVIAQRVRLGVRQPGARVLVTSAEHGEGKTSLTAALARSLAEQGVRVLAVDAGRRDSRPASDSRLSRATSAYPILRRLLPFAGREPRSTASLAEAFGATDEGVGGQSLPARITSPMPGIDLLTFGRTGALASASSWGALAEALRGAAGEYDAVLIDGPPILPYADAQVLAQMSDAVLLVARSEHTPTSSLKAASARMADCDPPVLGLVLNETDQVFLRLE